MPDESTNLGPLVKLVAWIRVTDRWPDSRPVSNCRWFRSFRRLARQDFQAHPSRLGGLMMSNFQALETTQCQPLSVERIYLERLDRGLFGSLERFSLGFRIHDPADDNRVIYIFEVEYFSKEPVVLLRQCLQLAARKGIDLASSLVIQDRPVLISNETLLQFHQYAKHAIDRSFKDYRPLSGEILDIKSHPEEKD